MANKRKFDRPLLAQVYDAMILPHYLYFIPFWHIFTATDKLKLRSLYYKYANHRGQAITTVFTTVDKQ